MRATAAFMLVASACSGVDISSESDDELAGTSIVSTGSVVVLSVGTLAALTETGRRGHPIEDRREIALAIARGSGRFVSDLAAWLELPSEMIAALGENLRAARPVLVPALSKPISVKSFETLLGVALCRDPKLRYHAWKRFQCQSLVPL